MSLGVKSTWNITMNIKFKLDDLTDIRISEFLSEHIMDMRSVSPPESKHALDLNGLKQPEIKFWSVWDNNQLIGSGAIKILSSNHAEIKSMRVSKSYRNRGIGSLILKFIINQAKQLGISRLSLETGSMDFFIPARKLYEKHGFEYCEPFGNYKPDKNSSFMTIQLDAQQGDAPEPASPAR